ncbi:MAG: FAD:protein FMN transferase, partial [Candidatus Omnitrophica bacterium]|nr:FAD:protein FMN transferase [Candidatus Omnitrophota bacterium]
PPSADEIRSMLPNLKRGYLLTDGHTLKKINKHSTLDFSGVAKGYAVDRMGMYLKSLSINRYLVNIGGELTASGNAPDQMPGWKVAILSPDSGSEMLAHIRLKNQSIATSGIYFNQFSEGEKIYSHLISPEDGSAVHDVVSISIVSDNCGLADALATGLAVLEPNQLQNLLREKQSLYDYLIVTKSGQHFRSNHFPQSV